MKFLPHAQIHEPIHIDIPRDEILDRFDRVLMGFGSCFAQNIQEVLRRYGFRYWYNRDICAHYSSESIANRLESVAQGTEPGPDELYTFEDPPRVHAYTYFFKRLFYGDDAPKRLLDRLRRLNEECQTMVRAADLIVVTLGTSWVYRLNRNNKLIVVVQGIPKSERTAEMLSVAQNVQQLHRIVDAIKTIRSGGIPRIMLTVSPQRYLFSGQEGLSHPSPYVDNIVSKSILRAAVHEFMLERADDRILYFPSYELIIDELRQLETLNHYDHTHIDQVHTPQYIGKRLFGAYASDTVLMLMEQSEEAIRLYHEVEELIAGGLEPDHPLIRERVQTWVDKATRLAPLETWSRNTLMALGRTLQRSGWHEWLVDLFGGGGYHPYTKYDVAVSLKELGRLAEARQFCQKAQAELELLPQTYPDLVDKLAALRMDLESTAAACARRTHPATTANPAGKGGRKRS